MSLKHINIALDCDQVDEIVASEMLGVIAEASKDWSVPEDKRYYSELRKAAILVYNHYSVEDYPDEHSATGT